MKLSLPSKTKHSIIALLLFCGQCFGESSSIIGNTSIQESIFNQALRRASGLLGLDATLSAKQKTTLQYAAGVVALSVLLYLIHRANQNQRLENARKQQRELQAGQSGQLGAEQQTPQSPPPPNIPNTQASLEQKVQTINDRYNQLYTSIEPSLKGTSSPAATLYATIYQQIHNMRTPPTLSLQDFYDRLLSAIESDFNDLKQLISTIPQSSNEPLIMVAANDWVEKLRSLHQFLLQPSNQNAILQEELRQGVKLLSNLYTPLYDQVISISLLSTEANLHYPLYSQIYTIAIGHSFQRSTSSEQEANTIYTTFLQKLENDEQSLQALLVNVTRSATSSALKAEIEELIRKVEFLKKFFKESHHKETVIAGATESPAQAQGSGFPLNTDEPVPRTQPSPSAPLATTALGLPLDTNSPPLPRTPLDPSAPLATEKEQQSRFQEVTSALGFYELLIQAMKSDPHNYVKMYSLINSIVDSLTPAGKPPLTNPNIKYSVFLAKMRNDKKNFGQMIHDILASPQDAQEIRALITRLDSLIEFFGDTATKTLILDSGTTHETSDTVPPLPPYTNLTPSAPPLQEHPIGQELVSQSRPKRLPPTPLPTTKEELLEELSNVRASLQEAQGQQPALAAAVNQPEEFETDQEAASELLRKRTQAINDLKKRERGILLELKKFSSSSSSEQSGARV